MSKKRYNRDDAVQRARSDVATTSANGPAGARGHGVEYLLVSVWEVEPAPGQARRDFTGLEELAASIKGSQFTEGLGVMEPILVRRLESGKYELIDGERRLRACRRIAEESADREYRIPARVFAVKDSTALLMAQTANLERVAPRPVEVALGYQAIREALRVEIGERAATLRSMVGLGWHEKSQIGDYLKIAAMLADGTVQAAGFVTESGEPDVRRLCALDKKELDRVVAIKKPDARAVALRTRVEARATAPASRQRAPQKAQTSGSPQERRTQIATTTGVSIRIKEPAQMLEPGVAAALVRDDLAPTILAVTDRAHAGGRGDGFFVQSGIDHLVLVMPTGVEALSIEQLETLVATFSELRDRAGRMLRHLRKSGGSAGTRRTATSPSPTSGMSVNDGA